MRPSIEERMNQWLNEQADRAQIPDHQRQRFIDHMRGTSAFAGVRLSMLVGDLWRLFAMRLARRREGGDA